MTPVEDFKAILADKEQDRFEDGEFLNRIDTLKAWGLVIGYDIWCLIEYYFLKAYIKLTLVQNNTLRGSVHPFA